MNKEIEAILSDPKWQEEKQHFDKHCHRVDVLSYPFIAGAKWDLLEFTTEDKKAMGGDPDIAFRCQIQEWFVRMDYAAEIGDSSFYWKAGHEQECLEELEFFVHGRVARRANESELAEYAWALESAIKMWVSEHFNL